MDARQVRPPPGGLIERDYELGRIAAALESAATGRGRLVEIAGGAGLGKTSLLDRARDRSREAGFATLSARGEGLEAKMPWSLARQLLVPALSGSLADRQRLLSGAAAPAAALLDPGSAPPAPAGGLLPLVHAVYWVVAGIAERAPTALLVDDVQWADEASLQLLAYVGRRLADLPVALIVARRPDFHLRDLGTDPTAEMLELRPLSTAGVAGLVRETLGESASEEFATACAQASAGNPFYLRELLRAVLARPEEPLRAETIRALVPAAVSRSVFLRLSQLRPEAAALARGAAVLGDRAALPHAAELAGLDHEQAAAAFDELARAEIVADGEPLRFVHPLVGTAVHDDLPPAERAAWHVRAAQLLDREGVESERLAPHLLAAGARADPWVVDRLEAAAAAAAAKGGIAAAAEYLTRALDEPPPRERRVQLLAELGRLESALGRPSAPERLRAALELTEGGDERARMLFELGRALVVAGKHGEAARAFASGLVDVEQPDSELGRELRAAWWAAASADPVERAQVLALGDPDLGDEQESTTLGQRQLLAQLAQERAFAGRPPDELRSLATRAWDGGALLAGETSDGLSWSLVTGALLAADELELELEVCDAVIADARRRGSPMAYATASYCRSWPLLRRGQIHGAVADAQAAVDAREDGWATFLPMAAACLALAQIERGAVAEAAAAIELADTAPGVQDSNQYPFVLIARGRLLVAGRHFDAGLAAFKRAGELLAAAGFDNPTLFPWRAEAADAAALGGRKDEALTLAEAALADATRTDVPATVARALRARAAAGGGEQAIAHLHEALALLPPPPRLERIYLLVELGAALRRANRRREAVDALHQALALAVDGGAAALAERAHVELSAAGARVTREPNTDGFGALTPAERRVTELAAAGHANREIAQMLFVTVKTVEYHLGNVYRKLGVNRRSQLAGALAAASARSA